LASRAGDFATSQSLLLEALPITRQEPDQRLTVLALADLGWGAGAIGDESEMTARYEEAIAPARAAKDDWALGLALNGYCSSGPVRADPARARPLVEEALSLFRRIGDAAGIAHAASTVGDIAMDAGDLEVAERLLRESIESAREIDNRPTLAGGLLDRAILSLLRDDVEEADTHLQPRSRPVPPTTTERQQRTLCPRQARSRQCEGNRIAPRCCGARRTPHAVPTSTRLSPAYVRDGNHTRIRNSVIRTAGTPPRVPAQNLRLKTRSR
jgi:tetratricopeptide (TPR) repeat protein